MAKAVGFEGASSIFRAPPGMAQDECYDLQAFSDGQQVISCWRLTAEELQEVQRTGVVWLSITGRTLSPVFVSGTALITIDGRPSEAEPDLPIAERSKG
ncbi:MAG: hypothetical protein KDJ19_00545 [Hyphomicrobiaceae bacterium]|nr:hypothetical protein [Hyphomicrobiaceae bacterium]MCC0024596.1 hypothetical protein [Hyphomicrobiaceae bacterium]